MSRIKRRAKEAAATGNLALAAKVFNEYRQKGQPAGKLRRIFADVGIPISGTVSLSYADAANPHLYK